VNKSVLSAVVLVVASDVLLGGIFYHAAIAAPGPSDAEYSAAIEAARAGNANDALPVIEDRYRADPTNSSVIYDYILVLGWARRLMEALSVYESLPPAERPIYLEAAVARDYRDTGAYDKALMLYRQGRAHYPEELTFAYGEILTLTDAGLADEAVAQAGVLLAAHPEDIELLSAAIYASAATDHHAETAALAERMLAIAPQDRDALRARVFALRGLGQFMLALELAEQSATAFSSDELRNLIGDQLAALVRQGEQPTKNDVERLAAIDRAIAELDRRIAIWGAEGAGGTPEAHTARFNRILALEDRGRSDEVVAEYNALRSEGVEVPPYALKAVADAYARHREPENARRIYELALAGNPKDFDARVGLFYSELESEDFDAAFSTIDALAAEQTPNVTTNGQAQQTPNSAWLRANLIAALARFYAGDTPEAQRRVTSMIILAPNDASLRQALGTILLGRGKPHAADRQFANGQIILPNDMSLAAARADVAITRGDRVEGAAEAERLIRLDPSVNAVTQLARRVEILERPELSVRWNASLQSTRIPVSGNSFAIDTQLYSAPINDTYRIYAGYGYAIAKLPEGTIVDNHAALGVEYTGLDLAANAEISNDSSPHPHAGGRAAIAWTPDDSWRFSGAMQIFSSDTPLRALKYDISANSWMVRAAFSPSDFQSYSLMGELVTFSDGNDRAILDANANQRLITQPHFTIDAIGELYTSQNSLRNAPYFNPAEDLSGSLTLTANQILYRRYSFVYSHRLSVTGGDYLESGFAGGFSGNLYYEQRLRVNDSWEGALGVQLRRQPYDGHAENSFAILGSIDWRF
jgi:biofilm PGA synthesis protein PgaA